MKKKRDGQRFKNYNDLKMMKSEEGWKKRNDYTMKGDWQRNKNYKKEYLKKKKITKKSIAKGEWYLKETELRKNKDKERRA